MYTIRQVSETLGLPVSTIRYYDKEGLLPDIQRVSGIRKFSDKEIETLRIIECLKKTRMSIRDIRQFMDWCTKGPSTYPDRKELFENRKNELKKQQKELEKNMAMIQFKCWYYEQAIADGNEDRLQAIIPDQLPAPVKTLYELAHNAFPEK